MPAHATVISPENKESVTKLKEILSKHANFVVTTYSGLSVVDMGELRSAVREKDGRVKVVKNNLFRIALKESAVHASAADAISDKLKGPIAVTFAGADISAISKALVDFSKKNNKVEVITGFLEGKKLDKAEVQQIANLPSREQLLTIIGRGLNTPATKIAIGMKEVITSLARGIRAVGEKNG
ncbi:MAG TPA: 50S ribosomal protein L10 [Leptospiraceae bacterium]|nr:50S ribosomal protein L10 [Leptospirales bacterium]HMU82461.1 50S ribosomal protein L10 [Leptospiraceae bacterium]HMW59455.1 50S ribosomal protein L10 [Leptospiraceae bacterium]HMX57327.1 50S ribosomal protein L10 [Leptospiraceae bacterium]HMY46332.1 50S ribosomal protein L10 [Leptospiraceae bacterium]